MTDCPSSLPSAFSTATEMVSRWTSRPIYLMLSIGCSFREVWFTASHSNHNLLRKGRPFIMRAPPNLLLVGWDSLLPCRVPWLLHRSSNCDVDEAVISCSHTFARKASVWGTPRTPRNDALLSPHYT